MLRLKATAETHEMKRDYNPSPTVRLGARLYHENGLPPLKRAEINSFS